MTKTWTKKPEPAQRYPAWGAFTGGEISRHPVYGPMNPAKRVLILILQSEGWALDLNTAEWVSEDGTQRARMSYSADGMTAWLQRPFDEETMGRDKFGIPIFPADTKSHRITLTPEKYIHKRIEDCVPGDVLDMGIFAGIDPRSEGQGPNTVNVALEGGSHYTETADARVRVWRDESRA